MLNIKWLGEHYSIQEPDGYALAFIGNHGTGLNVFYVNDFDIALSAILKDLVSGTGERTFTDAGAVIIDSHGNVLREIYSPNAVRPNTIEQGKIVIEKEQAIMTDIERMEKRARANIQEDANYIKALANELDNMEQSGDFRSEDYQRIVFYKRQAVSKYYAKQTLFEEIFQKDYKAE